MEVIYPGSFDPVTNGHLDIIKRCSKKFDNVIIGLLNNREKKGMFSIDERLYLLRETTKDFNNVKIESFSGLLTEFVKKKKCNTIIRGLRALSDYEYEMQMALVNKKLHSDIETLFMVSSSQYVYLSSSIVKEIATYGGDISCFVPKIVEESIKDKLKGGL